MAKGQGKGVFLSTRPGYNYELFFLVWEWVIKIVVGGSRPGEVLAWLTVFRLSQSLWFLIA